MIDDLSSISGSESDSEEDIKPLGEKVPTKMQGSPLLMFSTSDGTIHAVYRCLLSHTKVLYQFNVNYYNITLLGYRYVCK